MQQKKFPIRYITCESKGADVFSTVVHPQKIYFLFYSGKQLWCAQGRLTLMHPQITREPPLESSIILTLGETTHFK